MQHEEIAYEIQNLYRIPQESKIQGIHSRFRRFSKRFRDSLKIHAGSTDSNTLVKVFLKDSNSDLKTLNFDLLVVAHESVCIEVSEHHFNCQS